MDDYISCCDGGIIYEAPVTEPNAITDQAVVQVADAAIVGGPTPGFETLTVTEPTFEEVANTAIVGGPTPGFEPVAIADPALEQAANTAIVGGPAYGLEPQIVAVPTVDPAANVANIGGPSLSTVDTSAVDATYDTILEQAVNGPAVGPSDLNYQLSMGIVMPSLLQDYYDGLHNLSQVASPGYVSSDNFDTYTDYVDYNNLRD